MFTEPPEHVLRALLTIRKALNGLTIYEATNALASMYLNALGHCDELSRKASLEKFHDAITCRAYAEQESTTH
jgi:hypothetical protein